MVKHIELEQLGTRYHRTKFVQGKNLDFSDAGGVSRLLPLGVFLASQWSIVCLVLMSRSTEAKHVFTSDVGTLRGPSYWWEHPHWWSEIYSYFELS